MVKFPRGIQQTRLRLMSSHLFCGDGYKFIDSKTRRTLLELSMTIVPVSHGYAVVELFGRHHVLYNVTLSDELKDSGVSIEKLMEMAVNKISQETKSESTLYAVSTNVEIEEANDPDGTNAVVLWLQDTPIADFLIPDGLVETEEALATIEVVTELKGPTIRFQLSQILHHAICSL